MVHLTTALDASSGVPLYEQLYRSLAGEMRSGTAGSLIFVEDGYCVPFSVELVGSSQSCR